MQQNKQKEHTFKPVTSQLDFVHQEEEVLSLWIKNKTMDKSIDNRRGNQRFVFYDGPPTANGKPHMGHAMQMSFKDLFCRYKAMKGFLVERKAGWDCHGLPVEIEVEKELGLRGKQDILTLKDNEFDSVKFFNEKCRESVFRHIDNFETLTERLGFWNDFNNPYVTLSNEYIESVWWFVKIVSDKGLLYKDYKVVPYCPRCGTSLSSHELAQGYKDNVEDPSVYVKFELKDEPGTYLLVWTTTPWTLPGNVALAVGKNVDYVEVQQDSEKYVLAEKRLKVLKGDYKVLGKVKVEELLGKEYKPLYPYLNPDKKAYFVTEADFASDEEGTGIVHTAVMYGVEDFELGKKLDLPMKHLVNTKGEFVPEVTPFAGMFVKEADPKVIEDLKGKNQLYKSEVIKHTYPFCWRCSTPLLYYALDSWFIKTTAVKQQLFADNQEINWVPKTIKTGRMQNWFETLIDWNISRNRFWGTPLPVWTCEKGHQKVVGSMGELKQLNGKELTDLHRPFIDEVTFKCPECGGPMHRVPEVMDVWLDSGAMPFAQWHYPFENKDVFREWYPADFIVEGNDLTRGWFYTLMAEAMLMEENPPAPFKNVIATGMVLDEFGKKMSKSKGNVVNPLDTIPLAGADAVRWFIYTSATPGNNYIYSKETLLEKHRKFTMILWNSYKFFVDYASLHNWKPGLEQNEPTVLDAWLLSQLNELVSKVNEYLDAYNPTSASRLLEEFVADDLSTWYIRRGRGRVSLNADVKERNLTLNTLYEALVTVSKALAPFMPFVSEVMYRNLTGEESVHLADYPEGDKNLVHSKLASEMTTVREVVEQGHAKRKEAGVKLRQPLNKVVYSSKSQLDPELERIVADELNVKNVRYKSSTSDQSQLWLDTEVTPELAEEGEARELIRQIQQMRKEKNLTLNDRVRVLAPKWPKKYEDLILKSTVAVSLMEAKSLQIEKV